MPNPALLLREPSPMFLASQECGKWRSCSMGRSQHQSSGTQAKGAEHASDQCRPQKWSWQTWLSNCSLSKVRGVSWLGFDYGGIARWVAATSYSWAQGLFQQCSMIEFGLRRSIRHKDNKDRTMRAQGHQSKALLVPQGNRHPNWRQHRAYSHRLQANKAIK